jgi:hypothetical protein
VMRMTTGCGVAERTTRISGPAYTSASSRFGASDASSRASKSRQAHVHVRHLRSSNQVSHLHSSGARLPPATSPGPVRVPSTITRFHPGLPPTRGEKCVSYLLKRSKHTSARQCHAIQSMVVSHAPWQLRARMIDLPGLGMVLDGVGDLKLNVAV